LPLKTRSIRRLVKFPMAISTTSADDSQRGRPWREPAGCPRTPRLDAGGDRAPQRGPSDGGLQDRGRQTRPASLDRRATCQGGRSLAERVAALIIGPIPFLPKRVRDRPSAGCLAILDDHQARHDLINSHDLHPGSPLPIRQRPADCPGQGVDCQAGPLPYASGRRPAL